MKQYIVDAFTPEPFAGNPAAVCVMERWPSEASMTSLRLVTTEGTEATVKVKVSPWQAMVAAPGFSTPTSAGGVTVAVPPQATIQ